MKNKIETCDAHQLLRKSTLLRVNGDNVENWTVLPESLHTFKAVDDTILFLNSDTESFEFTYEFTKRNLMEATVEDNCISIEDIDGKLVKINCYHCVPVTL